MQINGGGASISGPLAVNGAATILSSLSVAGPMAAGNGLTVTNGISVSSGGFSVYIWHFIAFYFVIYV